MTWTSKRRKTPRLESRYRSRFEQRVAEGLEKRSIPYAYESFKIEYEVPSRTAKYLPDFQLLHNSIVIEVKGRFVASDRAKHLWIKAQHPEIDIRFVFQNSQNKLYRGSPTTYAMWCEKHGFRYADKEVPVHWIKERPKHGRTTSNPTGKKGSSSSREA